MSEGKQNKIVMNKRQNMDITLFTLNLPSPLSFLFKPPLSNIEFISNAFVVIRNIYFLSFCCGTSQLVQPYILIFPMIN